MKVLNLTNNKTSDIKFEISKFPDGQQQVKILSNIRELLPRMYLSNFVDIQIKSRLNNFKDLELIICAVKSLKGLEQIGLTFKIHLYTPYFLGSRSDRKFEEGSNNYLKDVICPIINSLNFESVTVLDPHSSTLEACLNNFKKVDNLNLINFAFENIGWNYKLETKTPYNKLLISKTIENSILISPDAGANKKIFKVAEQIGYTGDIITCSKSRDENGKLSKTEVPYSYRNHGDKDMIIIDDICDGGATFLNIAKTFKNKGVKSKIYLIVTHGIFSKGFEELSKYFDGIYCTNSYSNIYLENNEDLIFGDDFNVKQLNVF